MGRSFRNANAMAPPKATSSTSVTEVSRQLSTKSTAIAMAAVSRPPTSWMMPVPTRFRIPVASVMIREISTPTFVASK